MDWISADPEPDLSGERADEPGLQPSIRGQAPRAMSSSRSTRSSVEDGSKQALQATAGQRFMIIICAVSGWRSVASSGMPCA